MTSVVQLLNDNYGVLNIKMRGITSTTGLATITNLESGWIKRRDLWKEHRRYSFYIEGSSSSSRLTTSSNMSCSLQCRSPVLVLRSSRDSWCIQAECSLWLWWIYLHWILAGCLKLGWSGIGEARAVPEYKNVCEIVRLSLDFCHFSLSYLPVSKKKPMAMKAFKLVARYGVPSWFHRYVAETDVTMLTHSHIGLMTPMWTLAKVSLTKTRTLELFH